MGIELNPEPMVFTVKFVHDGREQLEDFHALGHSDAEDKLKEKYPDAKTVTIFRKK